jgi:RNA polymerase sigma-70 factor (ECF subfamily)
MRERLAGQHRSVIGSQGRRRLNSGPFTSDLLTAHGTPDTHDVVMQPTGARSEDAAVLIARIAGGDREAFSRFYDAFAGIVFGLIRRVLRDPGASEEVLQEVFWQVWREASRYDAGRGTPEAWLLMRAKSRAIDRLRSVRRRDRTFVTPVDESSARAAAPGLDRPGATMEDRDVVERALDRLPAAQREVIRMAFFEGLTQSEIASRLVEPLGTVKTRARLGLERLRSVLRGEHLSET